MGGGVETRPAIGSPSIDTLDDIQIACAYMPKRANFDDDQICVLSQGNSQDQHHESLSNFCICKLILEAIASFHVKRFKRMAVHNYKISVCTLVFSLRINESAIISLKLSYFDSSLFISVTSLRTACHPACNLRISNWRECKHSCILFPEDGRLLRICKKGGRRRRPGR